MAEPAAPSTGRIFISYRREESAYPAGWLYDRLVDRYGADQVFKDIDSIQLGDDFVDSINRAVGSCDVLLALIGDQWVTLTDAQGRRRLDDPGDFVRLEVEAALTRNVRVIPILVEGATMPRADELPPSLAGLVRRQALELSPARFDFDTSRLLRVLDTNVAEVRTSRERAPATAPAPAPPERPPRPRTARLSSRARLLLAVGAGLALVLMAVAVVATRGGDSVVFQDDFSSQAQAWYVVSDDGRGTGDYVTGAYRISVRPPRYDSGAAAFPGAGLVRPPPRDLVVTAEARRPPGTDPNTDFGLLCRRTRTEAYLFAVSDDYAKIVKLSESDPYEVLWDRRLPLDVNARNGLRAECSSVEGGQAVRLAFSVNDQPVKTLTDRSDPLPPGTVGLFLGTAQGAQAECVAEFDDVVVRKL